MNIARLLEVLHSEWSGSTGLQGVVVVSSGSTDSSDRLVLQQAGNWSKLRLVTEPERRGKASAINQFLKIAGSRPDVLSRMSGDGRPEVGAVRKLVDVVACVKVGGVPDLLRGGMEVEGELAGLAAVVELD